MTFSKLGFTKSLVSKSLMLFLKSKSFFSGTLWGLENLPRFFYLWKRRLSSSVFRKKMIEGDLSLLDLCFFNAFPSCSATLETSHTFKPFGCQVVSMRSLISVIALGRLCKLQLTEYSPSCQSVANFVLSMRKLPFLVGEMRVLIAQQTTNFF